MDTLRQAEEPLYKVFLAAAESGVVYSGPSWGNALAEVERLLNEEGS